MWTRVGQTYTGSAKQRQKKRASDKHIHEKQIGVSAHTGIPTQKKRGNTG
jgi:hypothetical protein